MMIPGNISIISHVFGFNIACIAVEVALHYGDIKEKGYREVLVSSSRKASEWGTRSGIYRVNPGSYYYC